MKNKTVKINKYEKILHWLVLLTFLGLCSTALAAEYFFSKEAIMDSFKKSLPLLDITIPPSDQFFISRIARRDTWDIHLYFGAAFGLFILIWTTINLIKRNKKFIVYKALFFTSALVAFVTGVYMWLRLHIEVSEEAFTLLKHIHYYAYWTFIITLLSHVAHIVYNENKKKRKGSLSNMISFKNLISVLALSLIGSTPMHATKSDLSKWANDNDYIEGVMYIEGEKGFDVLYKEISNCPYDKCKLEDVDQTQFGTKKIEIVKPDYKKAIDLLITSSNNGNPLASEKLLHFLVKRIDFKSKKPNGYLLNVLKEDTGLNYDEYRKLVLKTIDNGLKSKKSCYSAYLNAEILEKGLLKKKTNKEEAIKYYKKALDICPDNNMFKIISSSKVKR